MDGSYSQPFGRSQSPQTPSTPQSAYQINISRQKTRKWVEAKAQNYDGDDWGTDEYDDEPAPEPVPAMPSQLVNARPEAAPRLPSESRRPNDIRVPSPSEPVVAPAASATPRSAGLPPLQVPDDTRSAPVAPDVSQSSNFTSPSLPDSSTLGKAAAAGLVSPESAVTSRSYPRDSEAQSHQGSPHLATVPETTSSDDLLKHGMSGREAPRDGVQRFSLDDTVPSRDATSSPSAAARDIDRGETSGSPQLPDVSRMSSFGMDFTLPQDSTDSSNLAALASPMQGNLATPDTTEQPPSAVASQGNHEGASTRPNLSGGWVTETPPVPESEAAKAGDIAEVSSMSDQETGARLASGSASTRTSALNPIPDPRALPPLRTPSPHGTGSIPQVDPDTAPVQPMTTGQPDSAATPQTAGSEIPPTRPLQPQKHGIIPAGYELPPVQRQLTLSTVTSSPQKESDILRDEIIKSLSPRSQASPEVPQNAWAPADENVRRDSSYSLSGYDAYWADQPRSDSNATKTQQPQSPSPDVPQQVAHVPPTAPLARPSSTGVDDAQVKSLDARKRFSWEMESEDELPPTDAPPTAKPDPIITLPSDDAPPDRDSSPEKSVASPVSNSQGLSAVSHQVSKASTAPPGVEASIVPVPPSPVSMVSEARLPEGQSDAQVASPDEIVSLASPTPPPVINLPAGAPSLQRPSSSAALPAFKEIMARPTSAERAAKFNETRDTFATLDSGLDQWITSVKTQHPEHANVSTSFTDGGLQSPGLAPSSAGGQPPAPQPYYQQYINASSQAVGTPPARPSRVGGQPGPSLGMASSFGPSGNQISANQIGAKGKEFMHSAGKMGKGLLSKGRSKLRGTGDKVFH